jgi:hypothetical protein
MSLDKFEKDLDRMRAGKNIAGNVKNTSINDLIHDQELIHEWEEYLLNSDDIFAYCSRFRQVDPICQKLSEKDFLMICIIMMSNRIRKLDDLNFSLHEKLSEIIGKD